MKKIFFFSLAVFFICAGAAAGETVRIAVAATGSTAEASVSAEAARCPYYLLFDGDGRLTDAIDNPQKNVRRGAGPSAAAFLVERGVTMVIAEKFGLKMADALKKRGIARFEYKGGAGDAVKNALKGTR
ncbi:MAG: hypothetical protein M0P57_12550 [Syntrophales bacterium]|jgi:predicted Fe-Mo cluster-binding NifX family protein|nr:hypothetical protein [Syntrophales bacterium]MDY0044395.1 NifB/NifX family molybdenum-iron cluster-binding protein [Syntrophales bacterium]